MADPGAPAAQCDGISGGIATQQWKVRTSFPVYVVALSAYIGAHAPPACVCAAPPCWHATRRTGCCWRPGRHGAPETPRAGERAAHHHKHACPGTGGSTLLPRVEPPAAGWLLFMVFAGVGLVALPLDMIREFLGRPKSTIPKSEYIKRARGLGVRANGIKACPRLTPGLRARPARCPPACAAQRCGLV